MTASPIVGALVAPSPARRRLAGLRPLVRKDTTEWIRGRRLWVVLAITTAFMALSAANSWIGMQVVARVPTANVGEISAGPLDNLAKAVGSQIFVVAAAFAVASLIVAERQAGTLAWVASKPVSRDSIWLSKWLTSSVILGVAAGLVPLAVTVATVTVLYGAVPLGVVAGVAVGLVAVLALFAAVGLAAGTVLPGQPAIAATGLAVFALVPVVLGLLPFNASAFGPTAMLGWGAGLGAGQSVSWLVPLAWAAEVALLVAFSLRRMGRLEL